jgi:gluconate transporter
VIIAGPLLGRMMQKIKTNPVLFVFTDAVPDNKKLPGVWASFILALFPVLLITLSEMGHVFFREDSWIRKTLSFLGDPTIALLLAVLVAIYQLGLRNSHSMETVMKWLQDAISGIAMILLIITAGGVLKQVLQDSGTGNYIASFSSRWHMPPLLFGWIITALLRVTIGSATVAGITAAGIVSPLVATGVVSPELMVLAVGSGSVFGSHINDSGFWMFKEFFRLSLKQTFLSWTVMETVISLVGLIGVLLLDRVI